jgi:hypothetical protein
MNPICSSEKTETTKRQRTSDAVVSGSATIPVTVFGGSPNTLPNHSEKKLFSCRKIFLTVQLLVLAALAGGCAAASALPLSNFIGSPNASSLQIQSSTEARLQEKNFIVVKTNVVGQSSGFSLFGILTIIPARFSDAMHQLYAKADMQPGRAQTLANLVMESDSKFFILYSIPKTSISADVIEFTSAATPENPPRPSPGPPPLRP